MVITAPARSMTSVMEFKGDEIVKGLRNIAIILVVVSVAIGVGIGMLL